MDVFVSYASEDRDRAGQVARALEESGLSVWWDRKIVTGETFDQTIERQLESARSVVVLWSSASVVSEWVKSEAAVAAERQVLVPALIDDVKIPLEFRRRQTANLIDWGGDPAHEGFQALREGVTARLGMAAAPRAPRPAVPHGVQKRSWRVWTIAGAVIGIVAIALLIDRGRDDPREPSGTAGAVRSSQDGTANTPAPGNPASGSIPNTNRSRVVAAPGGGNGIDNPAPLAFDAMHKVTLDEGEEYYFRLPEPASAITIVQDVRGQKRESRNLQTQLSILDQDGGVVQANAIRVNEIDVGYRRIASFSTKQPTLSALKLVNTSATADVWLAVSRDGRTQFFPFFGEIVPRPWAAGMDATGMLEPYEDVYYFVRLPRGEHRVILDFANPKREQQNLQGYLAVLDAAGGGQETLLRLNEIQVSHRSVGTLTVKDDEPRIVRLQNTNRTVNYNLRIPNGR